MRPWLFCLSLTVAALASVRLISASPFAGPERERPTEEETGGDVVCGPRCVQFLLRWYDKGDEDLIALARELQWPELEAGASLQGIQVALENRGIHTYPMRVSPAATLQWSHPVLLHLHRGTDSDDGRALGHYVVWLPSSTGADHDVWNGLAGTSTRPRRHVEGRMSGAILLTSPFPITDPSQAVRRNVFPWTFCLGLVFAAGGTIVLAGRARLVRFRCWCLSRFQKEVERCFG